IRDLYKYTNYTKDMIKQLYNLINNNDKKYINKELLTLTLILLNYKTALLQLTNLICEKIQHIEICGIGGKNPNPLLSTVLNLNYELTELLALVLNKKLN
ncbi:MAG: hypothetical protein QXX23_07205, partial [Thermoplasmata archaeon]